MRLAPTRLVPFSYFCTCWKVRPNASPSFSWLMPSMMRRMRTRLPTYLSTGLGALVDICSTPWDCALGARQSEIGICPRRQYRQILLGSVGEECRQFEQRNDWVYSRRARQNANCMVGLSTGGFPLVEIFADSRNRHGYAGVRNAPSQRAAESRKPGRRGA